MLPGVSGRDLMEAAEWGPKVRGLLRHVIRGLGVGLAAWLPWRVPPLSLQAQRGKPAGAQPSLSTSCAACLCLKVGWADPCSCKVRGKTALQVQPPVATQGISELLYL